MQEEIEKTVTRILEDWGMMLVEEHLPWEGLTKALNNPQKVLLAQVRFKGPFEGTYTVACQREFAKTLLNNVLGGLEDEVGDSAAQDGLCELVNVLSGNLLTTCFGEKDVFVLCAPECKEVTLDEAQKHFTDSNCYACLADGEVMALTFESGAE